MEYPSDIINDGNMPIRIKVNDNGTYGILRQIIKYFVIALVVAAVAYIISKNRLTMLEVILIGMSASIVYAIFDIVSPSVQIKSITITK